MEGKSLNGVVPEPIDITHQTIGARQFGNNVSDEKKLARDKHSDGATEPQRQERGTRRWGLHSQIEWRGMERAGPDP
ncbi:unnamed protein product [Arctia plantaginis]|uniref:Uncharacterized protein n=1 Tax=Arctia plantaginis TaxID=874455 RepID=A0A8S0YP97_ARCPL|nr:unnamed protein product [Arctia plantaginis]